jgi:hypothetical protein
MTGKSPASIEDHLVVRAKTLVARWFDLAKQPTNLRPKVLRGVDAIARELPQRANWFEVMTVGLDDSASLPIRINAQQYQAVPCRECLAVSTIVPGWGFGWSDIFKDNDVYEILSWFLHYARQYIHRSYVANLLMIVWEKYGKVLHPFGSNAIQQRYGPVIPMISTEHALDAARLSALKAWGSDNHSYNGAPIIDAWIGRNMLDPFLHQAVFHFLRAQNLQSKEFAMEAVVAFDCMVQSITAFLQARCHLATDPTRGEACERLGLPPESAELAEYTYFLRNNFGAHAGGWRWWDQYEFLDDDDLSEICLLAKAVLSAAADFEPQVRSVEPSPSRWDTWLFENFEMLWDSVWFQKLAKWDSK